MPMGAMVEIDCSRVTLKIMEPGVVFQLSYILCYNVLCDFVSLKNQCLANSLFALATLIPAVSSPGTCVFSLSVPSNTIIMCPFCKVELLF